MYPYSTNMRSCSTIMQLRYHGSIWWNIESKKLHISVADLTWEIFEERFRERFLSPQFREARADEFHTIRQGNMTVDQYEIRFFELRQYSCYDNDDLLLAHHFIRGLKDSIIGEVCMHQPRTLALTVEKARIA